MTQVKMLKSYLMDRGDITQAEAKQVFGIERLASRINDLRNEGMDIETVQKKDAMGKRYSRYVLNRRI